MFKGIQMNQVYGGLSLWGCDFQISNFFTIVDSSKVFKRYEAFILHVLYGCSTDCSDETTEMHR